MDNEKDKPQVVESTPVDLPEFKPDNLLKGHTFRQEGEVLICIDDPSITAKLPLGVRLYGEPGKYELKKVF